MPTATSSLKDRSKALDKILMILAEHDPSSQRRLLEAAAVMLDLSVAVPSRGDQFDAARNAS